MKAVHLICALLCVLFSQAQRSIPNFFANPSIGFFRLTTDRENINNVPVMLDFKIGMNIGKQDAIGFEFSSSSQSIPVSGRYNVQPPGGGSVATRVGRRHVDAAALGMFYERYFRLGKSFIFFPSAYGQYLKYKNEEKGSVFVGTDFAGSYAMETLHNYKARIGLNFNLQYSFSNTISTTLRFAQVDCRIWNKYEQNIFLELPLLLGIKYSFN